MDVNEVLTSDGENMFCEDGIRLAMAVLDCTRSAIRNSVSGSPNAGFEGEKTRLAIASLYVHTRRCDKCRKK